MNKKSMWLWILLLTAGLLCAVTGLLSLRNEGKAPGLQAGSSGEISGLPAVILDQQAFEDFLADRPAEPFSAAGVTWQGGAAACEEADGTVFLPCDPAAGLEKILGGLVPAEEDSRICVMADEWMKDTALAVREGHAFSAALASSSGAARFQIILTGLPALCMWKTDGVPITGKEDHSAQIRMIAPAGSSGPDDSQREMYCSFHVRGNVTSGLEKKPYRISLKNAAGEKDSVSWTGLREDDDWILNPLFSDCTRVREMTAYGLWEEVTALSDAPQASSRLRYVELFLDNAYQGIYGIQEPVDKKQLGLREGDLLYKIDRWDREYPYLSLYSESENAEETVIYTDRHYPCVEIRWPRSWDATATWGPMQAFHTFCFQTGDPGTLRQANVSADTDSILTMSLFCAMTHASDNNWKNSFLIARLDRKDTYTLYRTVWDLNYVFGDVFVYLPEDGYTEFDEESAQTYIPFEDSTYDFEAFLDAGQVMENALREKWAVWRKSGIDADTVCGMARKNMDLLYASGAMNREMFRWPQVKDPETALEEMEDWIRRRFTFLDDYLEQ